MEKYTNTNNIILTLTRKCQFSCYYCKMSRNKADISLKNIHKAIDLLLTSDDDDLTVQFFGGEPMLRFDLIKETVRYVAKKSVGKNKRIRYIITTNGFLLDQEKLDYISKNGITLMFSLDGAKKTNNKNRIIAGTSCDYYGQIIKNIEKAHKMNCHYFINMVVDVDEAGKVAENYLELSEKGFNDIHITYVLGKIWPEKRQKEFIGNIAKIKSEQEKKYQASPPFFYDYANEPFFSSPVIIIDVDGKMNLGCSIVLENLLPHLQKFFYQGKLGGIKNINLLKNKKEEHLFKMLTLNNLPAKERSIIENNLSFGMKIKKGIKDLFNGGGCIPLLELQLNSRCQFDCVYCELDRKMPDMDEKILYKGIDFLFTSKSETVRLQFFGGEPLLSFGLIEKGVNYAEKKRKICNKRCLYYLATNALALNKPVADFLKKNNFSIIISLDGDRATQEKNRPLADIKDVGYPYEALCKNVALLDERGIDYFVNLVITPENLNRLDANARFVMKKIKAKKIMISYALGKNWTGKATKMYFQKFKALIAARPDVRIMNLCSQDEPVMAAGSINMDHRGDLYRGCVLSMVKTFSNLRKINYIGNIKEIKHIDRLENDKTELIYDIISAKYSDEREKQKVLNNLELGFRADRFFSGNL